MGQLIALELVGVFRRFGLNSKSKGKVLSSGAK